MSLAGIPERSFDPRRSWKLRAFLVVATVTIMAVVYVTSTLLTDRLTEATRQRAEIRLASHAGYLNTELRRYDAVPLLLSRDPALIGALEADDYATTTQRLISLRDEIGGETLETLLLLDETGRTVAATNRTELGENHWQEPFFIEALRAPGTVFNVIEDESGRINFTYSHPVKSGSDTLGVIVAGVDLRKFERTWASLLDAVMVTDSQGRIVLSSEAEWRGRTVEQAMALRSPRNAIQRAVRATLGWPAADPDTYLEGEAVMRQERKVDFRGWRMTSFTAYTSVNERVNTVIALEIMAFALLTAGAFYVVSRRAQTRSVFFQRESAELRQLNAALQREIAERERAEKSLQVAEQTVEQTSKLAALGEMSAAVSHELNQPLAAMKTYLAGAKLLLERKRPDEALSSFQRLDGLIERMGTITRQLKSYARKGGDGLELIDVRRSVSSSIAMMEPQLRTGDVRLEHTLPRDPVMVMADPIRLEQVIVNLLRNAVDATKGASRPTVEIVLAMGTSAVLTVRDNGQGIADLENLFEPFYTTKAPGDGVGLGLAISSSIVADHGGRLTARNGKTGAVFELRLPLAEGAQPAQAAE